MVASACSGDAPPPAATVTDSAGITITLSPDVGATYATVGPEPLVSLGGPDVVGPEQFFQITNVQLDDDGRVWVSDGQSGELRVFDADGGHLLSRGRLGDGPGEFALIRALAVLDDSVWVADQRNARLSVYDIDGELVRTERLQLEGRAFPRPVDVYPDGSMLGQVPVVYQSRMVEDGQLLPSQVQLARFSADRAPTTLVEGVDGPPYYLSGNNLVRIPFTANAAFGLRGEELHFATGPEFRIGVYEGDRLVRIYGVDRAAQPVGEDDVARYRDRITLAYTGDAREAYLSALDRPELPDVLPAYTRLLAGEYGTMWARRYSSDEPWEVFSASGELLGGVRMPQDFDPRSIRGDRVAGVWLDELGVEYVRVYAVTHTRGD